jgi:hypothetical protein
VTYWGPGRLYGAVCLVGILGVLLVIGGNTPARIVGGVMVAFALGGIIVWHRFTSQSR